MVKTVLNVEGMSCEHCVKAIKNALGMLSGVFGVEVDLDTKTVTVEHNPAEADIEKIKTEVENQGYDII